ncbi:hypothetical protein [Jatrophihabitans endophyticus]|uniref:hypothetical protein n=1 Tax=Jatrophihabitans endophyticus TaxID=1206085 RepID=UPI0019D94738|nr:hypothetical protein [Jatrophihabitans endophyticus]MBE7187707.1 hypothetical protein [Jatrophihabitans endophyticus]
MVEAGAFENFAVMVGGASAALTGLLFVSVSLNRDLIVRHPMLRASAAQTLVLLIIPLILCALLLVPDQHRWTLAVELVVTAAVSTLVLLRVQRHAGRDEKSRIADLVDRRETSLLTTMLIVVGAATYWAGHGGGIYWLVPAIILSLVAGVLNAWFFLLGDLPEAES